MKKNSKNEFWSLLPNSLVAVMDIMGFSAVLENNDTDRARTILADTVLNCFSEVKKAGRLDRVIPKNVERKEVLKKINAEREKMEITVFSDTAVFIMPNIQLNNRNQLLAFYCTTTRAVETFFDNGFPVQCRIEHGDFLFNEKNRIIIGRAFSNAYRHAENMGYSGIEISDNAIIKSFGNPTELKTKQLLNIYGIAKTEVPDREGNFHSAYCIDWHSGSYEIKGQQIDLRQQLIEKFTMHGKTINARVLSKLDHTELLIRQSWMHCLLDEDIT